MPRAEHIPSRPDKLPEGSDGPATSRAYEIQLITPMFGGGVSTRVNDSSFPIRPTAIRGQLQFWWRATVGAQYETKEQLREAQSKIWGNTEQASKVQVRAEVLKVDPPAACARFERDHNDNSKYRSMAMWNAPFTNTALPYALFPFQGQLTNERRQIEVEPALCILKASFRLTLLCPDEKWAQVEPAIWAWVNFGGLGSRTRRGCGAIKGRQIEVDSSGKTMKTLMELSPQDGHDLVAMWKKYVPKAHAIRDWPTMPAQFLCHPNSGNPIDQWNKVIGLLKDFRQKAGSAPGHPRPIGPDRSWYPEPDTIRRITGDHSTGHDPAYHLSGGTPLPDGFPRAEFGLPIVFKFKDDRGNPPDPEQTTLHPYVGGRAENRGTPESPDIYFVEGEIMDRMASPLILKPLALANGSNALAVILPLQTRGVKHVTLLDDNRNELTSRRAVPTRGAAFASYPDSPLFRSPASLTTSGSVLEAFLNLAALPAGTDPVHKDTGYRRVP